MDKKVVDALAVIQASLGIGDVAQIAGPTLREVWERYEVLRLHELRSATTEKDRAHHWLDRWGYRIASTITPLDCAEYRVERSRQVTRRRTPPTVATINRELALLRSVLNWALDYGLLTAHGLGRLKMPKENNHRQTVLKDEIVNRLARYAPNDWSRASICLAADTGMRLGEVRNMQWSWIDGRWIHIPVAFSKTKRARTVRMTGRVADAIGNLPHVGDYVFCAWREYHRHGKKVRIGERTLYTWFEEAVAAAGVTGVNGEKIVFHHLRHRMVAVIRESRVPDKIGMGMTGHRSREAYDRYGQLQDREVTAEWRRQTVRMDRRNAGGMTIDELDTGNGGPVVLVRASDLDSILTRAIERGEKKDHNVRDATPELAGDVTMADRKSDAQRTPD